MKKRTMFFILLLLAGVFMLSCAMPTENDKVARQAFDQEEYDTALDAWKKMCQSGISDPDLFYNMGIAASRSGKVPESITAFEKALRFKPGNKIYQQALQAERSKIHHAIIPIEPFFIAAWWERGISVLRPGVWALIGLLLLSMALLRSLVKQDMLKLRLMYLPGSILPYAIAGLAFLIIGFIAYKQIHKQNEAIVFALCEMKQGPSEQSPLVREVRPGEKVKMRDHLSGWTKVSLLNLDEGWLKNDCYRVIRLSDCE